MRFLPILLGLVFASLFSAARAQEADLLNTEPAAPKREAFHLLDHDVEPGTLKRLNWSVNNGFGIFDEPTPVLIAHGAQPGPVLCLTAAIHGDELNGIEIVRRAMYAVDPQILAGTLIGVPIVNVQGFQRGTRYLPDRRDLNRHFPGEPTGSLASRVAASFFDSVIRHCDRLVDSHTGSFRRSNLPQLRADLLNPAVVEMTKGFGGIAVLHTPGASGTLRRAATDAHIPAVTMEVGEPSRLQPDGVAEGVKGIETLMNVLGMTRKKRVWRNPQPVFYQSFWVRADRGGILLSEARLGDSVRVGDLLGTVTDPLSNLKMEIIAPFNGKILSKALNQFVMPGFAAYRIGVEKTEDEVAEDAARREQEAGPAAPPETTPLPAEQGSGDENGTEQESVKDPKPPEFVE